MYRAILLIALLCASACGSDDGPDPPNLYGALCQADTVCGERRHPDSGLLLELVCCRTELHQTDKTCAFKGSCDMSLLGKD